LAFFGKVARNQSADASQARLGTWTANGEQMAREAADLAVKNSLIKNGIDVLVAKVKYNEKMLQGDAGKALTAATLSFASKATVFASRVFCANGNTCASSTEKTYSFAADTLKLASQTASCFDNQAPKCVEALKSGLKQTNLVFKYYGISFLI
jgi:hypothetical protein